MRRLLSLVATLSAALSLSSCYTQLHDEPLDEPPPPSYRAPVRRPAATEQRRPEPAAVPVNIADGDYTGYSILVDAKGHHMGKASFTFQGTTYKCEGENFAASEGTFLLESGAIVLVASGKSPDNSAADANPDSTSALAGRFTIERAGDWIQLVQGDKSSDRYREIGLGPAKNAER
jgi:hypothetical protein